jgi:hypothetical protein
MVREDLKKIENKQVRDDIAHDISSIRKLRYISEYRKKELIKDLLEVKPQTQDYDAREKKAEAIKLEDKPFSIDST